MLTQLQKLALICIPVAATISTTAVATMVSVDTAPLATEMTSTTISSQAEPDRTPQPWISPSAIAQPEKLLAAETIKPMTIATQSFQQGEAAQFSGQAEQALSHYSQALAIAQAEGHPEFTSAILHRVAQTYAKAHDRDRARAFYQDAIALARDTRNQYVLGEALAELAVLNEQEGKAKEALAYYQESLPKIRAVGNQPIEQQVVARISAIQQQQAQAKQKAVTVAQKTIAQKKAPAKQGKIAAVKAVGRSVVN
jgi:tetratricopeptide (TPR) repeat protein